MTAQFSAATRAIGEQYDRFQSSLETIGKEEKYLNYGFTVSRSQSYEERQARLCTEVFDAAEIGPLDVIVDVGFGSGEQDFLLARTRQFGTLAGFNIAERQVRYASERARHLHLESKLSFRHGEAEVLPGVADNSVDRLLAIECAFYFDRPRFYERVAAVLKPGGRAVLADIALSDHLGALAAMGEDARRLGTRSGNRREWEHHLHTTSVRSINRWTRPGAQQTVFQILATAPFATFSGAERRQWLKMAFTTQCVAAGLLVNALHYDLIVLEKRRPAAASPRLARDTGPRDLPCHPIPETTMLRSVEDFVNGWTYESTNTQKVMDAMSDASLSQSVSNDHRTLGRMSWHTVLTIGDVARQVGLPVDGPAADAPVPQSAKDIASAYAKAAASFSTAVKAHWTDAEMTKIENVWGQKFPRGIVLNFLMMHQAHHRGQMTVLMRQAGLTIPGVYGPAKEEWAAFGAPAPAV